VFSGSFALIVSIMFLPGINGMAMLLGIVVAISATAYVIIKGISRKGGEFEDKPTARNLD